MKKVILGILYLNIAPIASCMHLANGLTFLECMAIGWVINLSELSALLLVLKITKQI